jgi:serine-type D-Ala-D-Ala carboxypeptidase (penicillin-binding protein 5/6)
MSSHRAVRSLAALAVVASLGLAGPVALGATSAAAGASAGASAGRLSVAKPTPAALPAAVSWVGGKQLISTKLLADLPAGVPAPPQPKAAAWLVADLDTRQILAGRRVHVPLAPASTLKIFTALALAPLLDPSTVYTGRDDDAAIDGTKVGIVPGSTYTVDDLLHGMLMSSGNDCANALGNEIGGKARAVTLIQAEAQKLGAFDTVVRTTNGLDAAGQVSSAYDLALAGSQAITQPQLEKIMTTKNYRFPGVGKSLDEKRKRFSIQSHDKLLYNFPGATGVKNGYTVAARGSYVGTATRNGHSYVAVVLRAEGSTWHQTADLLDWAFTNGSKASPVGTLVKPGDLTTMIGPATGDATSLNAAGGGLQSGQAGTQGNADRSLRAALPSAQTSLTRPFLTGRAGQLSLAGAGVALVLMAFFVGRRPLLNRVSGRSTSRDRSIRGGGPRAGFRAQLPGGGRHRT